MIHPQHKDYCWLAEKQATTWLQRLEKDPSLPISLLRLLREEVGETRASLLNQQVALRKRAGKKFSAASRMFFTDLGLQQSSDERVASHKALRFASLGHVTDLCCGIGGDLMALGTRGPVLGVDRDPVVAWLARYNAQVVLGMDADVSIQVADVQQLDLRDTVALHLDPDRRPAARRHSQMVGYQPGLEYLQKQVLQNQPLALKLAPAAAVPQAWHGLCEREWIASRGECRQQVVWSGSLAVAPGQHTATCLSSKGDEATVQGKPDLAVPGCSQCGRYLYEPNPAILAAQLVGAAAQQFELHACWPNLAYLTSDQYRELPGFSCFEVQEVLPFDRKRVRSLLRQRKIGQLEVKKRGVQLDPSQVQQQLQGQEAGQATLLLAGTSAGVTAVLALRRSSTR